MSYFHLIIKGSIAVLINKRKYEIDKELENKLKIKEESKI